MNTFTHRDISLLYHRLEPYKGSIKHRFDLYREQAQSILDNEGGLDEFSKGYEKRGFIVDEKNGVRYTEWAPGVKEARLIGDFSECEDLQSVSTRAERVSGLGESTIIPFSAAVLAIQDLLVSEADIT